MIDGSWPTYRKRARHRIDDRFSELPEHLLRRALSFLDSRTAVQTCLLSRRWRSVWKGVPALNFDTESFPSSLSFDQFVPEILSRRYDSAGTDEISLEIGCDVELWEPCSTYQSLLDYAASHGTRRLRAVNHSNEDFFDWFYDEGFISPVIRMLTSLHLDGLKVYCPGKRGRVDPFAGFPNLRDLTLRGCDWDTDELGWDEEKQDHICLRISGTQMRNLRMERLIAVCKAGISARNLESFDYVGDLRDSEFVELHLPSLDRAYIEISGHRDLDTPENRGWGRVPVAVAARRLMNLFQGLHSARTLELHLNTFKILERIEDSFGFQISPFTRLKTLILNVECEQKSFYMPYLVSQYFLGNASNKEKKRTKCKVASPKV